MHFKSIDIATFLAHSATENFVRLTKRWDLRSANSASTTSPSHWPSSGDVWVQACFGFRRASATAWTRWCILVNKGFKNLAIVTKFSPLPEPCDNGKTTTCGCVYRAKSVNGELDATGEGARKLSERIVCQRRDMQRPIPYGTRGTVAQPASGHSCRPTSLYHCSDELDDQLSISKSSLPVYRPAVVSAAACIRAGRWDPARRSLRTWRDYPRACYLARPGVAVFEM